LMTGRQEALVAERAVVDPLAAGRGSIRSSEGVVRGRRSLEASVAMMLRKSSGGLETNSKSVSRSGEHPRDAIGLTLLDPEPSLSTAEAVRAGAIQAA
jgi:hypothetical protein